MINYGFDGYYVQPTTSANGIVVWTIISLILAIGGGIALYFTFLRGNKKVTGFLEKLRDFLNFKSLLIEEIIKVSYLVLAIFITLLSFGLIGTNFISFLVLLVLGNVALRITYEMSILLIKICKNTNEINKKLK